MFDPGSGLIPNAGLFFTSERQTRIFMLGKYSQSLQFSRPTSTMSIEEFRDVLKTVYSNQYFTNHGPLAREFESQLESFLKIDHAVAVGNSSLALLIALTAMEISGKLLVSSFRSQRALQTAKWLRLNVEHVKTVSSKDRPAPVVCYTMESNSDNVIVLTEPWGQRISNQLVNEFLALGLKIIIIAFDSFGARIDDEFVNQHPSVVTIFCFEKGKAISTDRGGAIVTNNGRIAQRVRNIRSSYGARKKTDVLATCNGRFSEFQAGAGLKSLSHIEKTIKHNRKISDSYREHFQGLTRIDLPVEQPGSQPNYQCLPIQVRGNISDDGEWMKPLGIQTPVAETTGDFGGDQETRTILLPVNQCRTKATARIIAHSIIQNVLPISAAHSISKSSTTAERI